MTFSNKSHVIAVIWDFDKTLTPGYMENPLFHYFHVEPRRFWDEVNHLPQIYKQNGITHIAKDTLYLNHILTYTESEIFKGLNNKKLRELGKIIEFYKGMPKFLKEIKEFISMNPMYQSYGIHVEQYVVSTGLKEMILGSKIAPFIDGVWANEFIEAIAQPQYLSNKKITKNSTIRQLGYVIDHTSKTRALFEINKGINKTESIDVNVFLEPEKRRVPFEQMIYIADGPSDIPCFSVINEKGGKTFAVYQPQSQLEFMQVSQLYKEKRVQLFGEADYRQSSYTYMAILKMIDDIAQGIITRMPIPSQQLRKSPRHIIDGEFVYED